MLMKSSKKKNNMAVIQSRPNHILYQCAKCGDDRTSFNVICDVCENNSREQRNDVTKRKKIEILDFNGVNDAKHWHVAGEVFAISDCLVYKCI